VKALREQNVITVNNGKHNITFIYNEFLFNAMSKNNTKNENT
jgi:hypothetical protein